MAFSKSKRFNDLKELAPPVGTYNPKDVKKEAAALGFDKSGRFIDHKDDYPGPGDFNISSVSAFGNSSVLFSSTPVKRRLNPSGKHGDERDKTGRQESATEIKELEREVKRLFQDRIEQARLLAHKDEDIKKLESRLQNALSDRSSLLAKVASLEKDIKDLHKSNDVLKNTLSSVESSVKKKDDKLHAELTDVGKKLEVKDKEVLEIKDKINKAVSMLIKDLVACEALPSDDTKTAESQLDFSDSLTEKIEKAKKGIETMKLREKMLTSDLKKEIAALNSEIEELKMKEEEAKLKLEHDNQLLMSKCKTVKHSSSVLMFKNWEFEDQIRYLKGEIFAVSDEKENTEQQTFEAKAETAGLLERIEVLEESEERLNENLKKMMEKCNNLNVSLVEERLSLSELRDTLKAEIQTSKTLQENLTAEQIERRKLEEELQLANASVVELNRMVNSLTKENNTVMNTVNDIQNHHLMLKDTCHCLTSQNESLKIQVDSLNACKNSLNSKLSEVMTSHKKTIDLYLQQIKDLETESQTLVVKNNQLMESVEELSLLKNSLCEQLVESDNSRVDLVLQHKLETEEKQKEIEELSTKEKQHEMLIKEKQNTIEELSTKEKQHEILIKEKQIQIEELSTKENKHEMIIKEKQIQIEELSTKEKQHEILIKEKQNTVEELSTKENEHEILIKEKQKEIEKQSKQLVQLTDELCHIKKELSQVVNEKATVETENVSLQSSNVLISDELKILKEEKQKTEVAQDCKIKSLADRCSELQKTLDDIEIANNQTTADLKAQLEHSIENIKILEQQHAEKLKIIDRENEHVDVLTCELDAMKLHNKDLKLLSESKDKQITDLNQKLSDARSTIDALTEDLDNKTLQTHIEMLSSQLSQEVESRQMLSKMHQMQIARLEEENNKLSTDVTKQEQSIAILQQLKQDLLNENAVNKEMSSAKIIELEGRLKSVENEWIDSRQEMIEFHNSELQDRGDVITHLEETCAELRQELGSIHAQMESEDLYAAKLEITQWKCLYEELLEKVSPFMTQIDAFELERQILLGESKNAQAEIDKLGQEYARLLGHQNQKQRIKHVEKMRAEKHALTKEVVSLRETTKKQNWTIDKLQTKLKALENKKTFDPSKAFKHGAAGKENAYLLASSSLKQDQCSPLKPGNRF
ncbi:hyaluronan mediated motility receptor-like [Gigantopelta aegis]|uniref:hyaluronan mediated motility receptor-like n=1 Tax=Gigantopelta aegis TaxID=1735272 RepID=UPI001B88C225|nr:hyaluronan mediated motility receptor-like [Gigantopelta aegis]